MCERWEVGGGGGGGELLAARTAGLRGAGAAGGLGGTKTLREADGEAGARAEAEGEAAPLATSEASARLICGPRQSRR